MDERDLLRTQHMHDQCLREQALNKPAGLEQRLQFGRIRSKDVPHQDKGSDVEDGRGRANPDHEAANILGIPFAGLAQKVLVHAVPGQSQLGDIVEQVLNQQVNGQHGQEGDEGTGHQNREHIAKVGAGRHVQVLDDIAKGLAAFDHAFFQNQQVLFQQDDVCRLLGNIRAAIDRNAHVGIAQGGGVVDAVTQKTDGVTIGL